MKENKLERLLRAAADSAPATPATMPFGFDTRVLALARGANGHQRETAELVRFVRRIGTIALAIFAVATAAAYQQFASATDQRASAESNAFALPDAVLESEVSP